MTRTDRKKLAKAARELAMECVAGTAPEFGRGVEFHGNGSPACALGHVIYRAGFRPQIRGSLYASGDLGIPRSAMSVVTTCNDLTRDRDGLPWALLSLADDLESTR